MNSTTSKIDNEDEIIFISEKTIHNEEKEEYRIKIGSNKSEDFLVFKIIPENYKHIFYFQKKLSLKELQQISPAFNYFKSNKEFIMSFPKWKYSFYEKDDKFIIQFNFFSIFGEKQLTEISFPKYFIDKDKAINDLLEEKKELLKIINNQKSKINDLESQQINILKEEKNYKYKYEDLIKIYRKLIEQFEILKIKNEKLYIENKSLKIDNFQGDNSNIILLMDDLQYIFTYIKQTDTSFQYNNLKLLYRGSRDGDDTRTCHQLCDNKENILILIKTDIGNIFGGYSKIGFKTSQDIQYVVDNHCFLFCYDINKIYPCVKNKKHLCYTNDLCGLCFSQSMSFFNNFIKEEDNLIYKETIKDYFNRLDEPCEMNGGKDKFRCEEIEVFQFGYN